MGKKFLMFIAVGFLLLSIGCTTEEMPIGEQLTAEQVRDRSIDAMKDVSTYAFDMDLSMIMRGGSANMLGITEMETTINGNGKLDEKNRKMQLDMTMSVMGMTMEMDQYIIDDTQYMKMPMTGWVKNKTSGDIWDKQIYARLEDDSMKSADVRLLDDERVDGEDCYVLDMETEDMEDMLEIITQSMGSTSSLDEDELEGIKIFGFKEWVSKKTFLVKKIVMDIEIEEEGTTMDMSVEMKFSDYNEPIDITLPEEAKDAADMGSMMTPAI